MSSYAAPVWQSDYLKDISSLDKITDYYKNFPTPREWSLANLGTAVKDKNGNWSTTGGIVASNYDIGPDSARFGKNAWSAPVERYVTPEQMQDYGGLTIDDDHNATYSRTGRSLGTMPIATSKGGREGIHPQYADYYLDLAAELDRIDPNVFQLDVSKVTAPEVKPITGLDDMTPLFSVKPLLTEARPIPKYY